MLIHFFVFHAGSRRAGVRGQGPVLFTLHSQSILSMPSEVLPGCRRLFDLAHLICDPQIYSTRCGITAPADLWGDPPAHSEGSLVPSAPKRGREGKIKERPVEELTPSFSMSKIRYCSFASMRFNFFFSLSLFLQLARRGCTCAAASRSGLCRVFPPRTDGSSRRVRGPIWQQAS